MSRPVNPQRRIQVLDSAITFLAEQGLSGLSLRRLASALGVSTNVISYQFGSKEGLIEAALERARSATTAMLSVARYEVPAASATQAIRRTWEWWRVRPERFAYPRLTVEAMLAQDRESPEQQRRPELMSFWIDYFAAWFQHDGYDTEQAEELSTLANAVLTGLAMDVIGTGDVERVDRSLQRFTELLEPMLAERGVS